MLTPAATWLTVAGTGPRSQQILECLLQSHLLASLLLRTCVCCSLAGLWALITSSQIDGGKAAGAQNQHRPVER